MSPLDLIRSRDGSMSQTKLAASCFHFALFVTVCWVTWLKQDFEMEMWILYGGFAVGHASTDKVLASVKGFKEKKLEMEHEQTTR